MVLTPSGPIRDRGPSVTVSLRGVTIPRPPGDAYGCRKPNSGSQRRDLTPVSVLGDGQAASEAETLASVLVGWLEGAIEAETYEMRVKAEAEAYAKERIRSERTVGFASETQT